MHIMQAAGVNNGRYEDVICGKNGLQRYGLEKIRRISGGVGVTDDDKAGRHLNKTRPDCVMMTSKEER